MGLGRVERKIHGWHVLSCSIIQTEAVRCYLGPLKGKQNRNVCRVTWINIIDKTSLTAVWLATLTALHDVSGDCPNGPHGGIEEWDVSRV